MTVILGLLAFLVPIALLVMLIMFFINMAKRKQNGEEGMNAMEIVRDIGSFILLVSSVISIVSIVFSAVDKKFVDPLKDSSIYDYTSYLSDDLRLSISVLIVIYPAYLALAYYRANYLRNNPDRRKIKSLTYLNYFIISVCSVFMAGSLITAIYNFLGGEHSTASMLKFLTIIIISAALGIYNYVNIKRNYDANSKWPMYASIASLIAVIVTIVVCVNIVGSPAEIRKMKLDDRRLENLSSIQEEVRNYWTKNYKLPESLDSIKGDGYNSYFELPSDPITSESYAYKILEDSKLVASKGQACKDFYPYRYDGDYDDNGKWVEVKVDAITCEIPSKATFEICANFDSVRVFDENGLDRSSDGFREIAASVADAYALKTNSYYSPGYSKNSFWNHDAKHTCFKREIRPEYNPDYTSY